MQFIGRYQRNSTKEVREGTSYSTAVETLGVAIDAIEDIPSSSPQPSIQTSVIPSNCKPVYFDLETT